MPSAEVSTHLLLLLSFLVQLLIEWVWDSSLWDLITLGTIVNWADCKTRGYLFLLFNLLSLWVSVRLLTRKIVRFHEVIWELILLQDKARLLNLAIRLSSVPIVWIRCFKWTWLLTRLHLTNHVKLFLCFSLPTTPLSVVLGRLLCSRDCFSDFVGLSD